MSKVEGKFGISQSVPRKEDVRFLRGEGRYMEDALPEGAAHAVFVRSPVAQRRDHRARPRRGAGDAGCARGLRGGRSRGQAGQLGRLRDGAEPRRQLRRAIRGGRSSPRTGCATPARRWRWSSPTAGPRRSTRRRRWPSTTTSCPCMSRRPRAGRRSTRRRLATSPTTGRSATRPRWREPSTAAAHATRLELSTTGPWRCRWSRAGATATWAGGRLHLDFSGQGVWPLRDELAAKLGVDAAAVRVTTPDVGGGFGIKGVNYPEYFAVAFAARELGRPVHWMSGRGESMLTDHHGRDHVTVAEAAFDADYRLQALRIRCVSNLGAYNSPGRPAHRVEAGAEGDARASTTCRRRSSP